MPGPGTATRYISVTVLATGPPHANPNPLAATPEEAPGRIYRRAARRANRKNKMGGGLTADDVAFWAARTAGRRATYAVGFLASSGDLGLKRLGLPPCSLGGSNGPPACCACAGSAAWAGSRSSGPARAA